SFGTFLVNCLLGIFLGMLLGFVIAFLIRLLPLFLLIGFLYLVYRYPLYSAIGVVGIALVWVLGYVAVTKLEAAGPGEGRTPAPAGVKAQSKGGMNMDLAAITTLVTTAFGFISAYLTKAGESFAKKAGEDMYKTVKSRLGGDPVAKAALDDLEASPADP